MLAAAGKRAVNMQSADPCLVLTYETGPAYVQMASSYVSLPGLHSGEMA